MCVSVDPLNRSAEVSIEQRYGHGVPNPYPESARLRSPSGTNDLRRSKPVTGEMEHHPVTLSWENINVYVREKKKKGAGQEAYKTDEDNVQVKPKSGRKQITRDGEYNYCD